MAKNKRWKRRAKRVIGVSDLLLWDCCFCELARDMYRYGIDCHYACHGQIRKLEKNIKNDNMRRNKSGI